MKLVKESLYDYSNNKNVVVDNEKLNESLKDLYNKVKDSIKTAAAKAELIQLNDEDTVRLGKAVWNKKKEEIKETLKSASNKNYYTSLKNAYTEYKNNESDFNNERLFYEFVFFFYSNLDEIKANRPIYYSVKNNRLINMTSKTPNNPAGT